MYEEDVIEHGVNTHGALLTPDLNVKYIISVLITLNKCQVYKDKTEHVWKKHR